jgi:pimeloyl-ACP methyl ester carboxylesterase
MTPARGAQEIAGEIPGAKTVTLRGCGHNLMAEKPDEVLDLLRDFLR